MRIGIMGMGGIGGFVGAHLAKKYTGNPSVEVVFICRGESLVNIRKKGILLKSAIEDFTARPSLASDQPKEIGELDVLFLTVKSFSLQEVIKDYKENIGPSTVLIPLLNGVNAKEMIQQVLPDYNEILEGCIYVASNRSRPGVVDHKGGPGKILLGGKKMQDYKKVIDTLSAGGLNISYREDMKPSLWTKFLFVSPVAAITTAHNVTFGELLVDEALRQKLIELMMEVELLAFKSGVYLADDVVSDSVDMLNKFSFESKSSLQLDYEQGNKNERKIFIDFVIERSYDFGLPATGYKSILEILKTEEKLKV